MKVIALLLAACVGGAMIYFGGAYAEDAIRLHLPAQEFMAGTLAAIGGGFLIIIILAALVGELKSNSWK